MNHIREWLFNTPWWMLIGLFIAGVAVWWSGNNRQHKNLKRAGLAVLLLAVIWAVVGWAIDTPIERATKGTRQFVHSVVARDRQTLGNLLHPRAALGRWGRQDIIDGALTYADQYGLRNATITGLDLDDQEQAGMITVDIAVFSTHESPMLPVSTIRSEWRLDWWENDSGQWQIKAITPRKVGNMDMKEVTDRYFTNRP
jgi:hypothetical protein